jgi:hypothetical protein
MNDFYNLEGIVPIDSFPWEEIRLGIAKSIKNASIFYGHDHSNSKNLTQEQYVWYQAISKKEKIKGLDILLTAAKTWHDAWYKLGVNLHWYPADNLRHFPLLQQWIKNSGIFKETGRQIIFIQIQGSNTPEHVDQNFDAIPAEYKRAPEFLWITEKDGKKLFVNNTETGNIVWFNSFKPHYTAPADGLRWSLRIDGYFTDEFKSKLKI